MEDVDYIQSPTSVANNKKSVKKRDTAPRGDDDDDAPKKKATGKCKPPTIEQLRRALGDKAKSRISMEKYTIAARTHFETEMDDRTFRELIAPNAEIVPALDVESLVYVAKMSGFDKISEVFGSTKVKGGNMYSHFSADVCNIIYYKKEGKADVWWTMH